MQVNLIDREDKCHTVVLPSVHGVRPSCSEERAVQRIEWVLIIESHTIFVVFPCEVQDQIARRGHNPKDESFVPESNQNVVFLRLGLDLHETEEHCLEFKEDWLYCVK